MGLLEARHTSHPVSADGRAGAVLRRCGERHGPAAGDARRDESQRLATCSLKGHAQPLICYSDRRDGNPVFGCLWLSWWSVLNLTEKSIETATCNWSLTGTGD